MKLPEDLGLLAAQDRDGLVSLLLAQPSVADCAAVVRREGSAGAHLVAYVVPSGPLSLEQLRKHLDASLPPGALPYALVPVASLPLTATGAVDHEALAALPVIDPGVAHTWERQLQQLPRVRRVAVMAEPRLVRMASLPMAAILPEWSGIASPPVVSPPRAAEPRVRRDGARRAVVDGGPLLRPADGPAVLADILLRAASAEPQRAVVHVLANGDEVAKPYGALLDEARRVLAGLRARGLRAGDKVILQIENSPDFFAGFWGCVLGGMVPVPVTVAPTYEQPNNALSKMRNVWQMLDRPPVLTSDGLSAGVRGLSALLEMAGLEVHTISALRAHAPDLALHVGAPDDLALLLFTSGSTGTPKAVMLSHRNLLSMSAGTIQMNRFTADDVTLNWMPLDHVGALAFLGIMTVDLGCSQIHASNEHILEDPVRWLDLIEAHRATISWAPNFAFELLNQRAAAVNRRKRDLSSMRFLVNAGEANLTRTICAFLDLLAPHGLGRGVMRPAFGMSETCAGITWSEGFSPEAMTGETTGVELGPPIPGASLRIVDERGEVLDEGQVGRLQVRGPSVFGGYYKNPEENQAAFQDGWFTTGDLGTLRGGRLVLSGRQKEDIIINGVNHYSHEIEAVVEQVEGVTASFTAACAVRGGASAEGESLAVFFHTPLGDPQQQAALLKRIRGAVARRIGITPKYLIPVARQDVPKTTIGKIQRSLLKRRFEAGEFAQALGRLGEAQDLPDHVPDWFYRRIWRPRTLDTAALPQPQRRTVLVFEDASGLCAALCAGWAEEEAAHGQAQGRQVIRVTEGPAFGRLAPRRFQIAPDRPEEYRLLLEAVAADGLLPDEILHLWAFDGGDREAAEAAIDSRSALAQAQRRVASSLLYLAQAWARGRGAPAPLRVNEKKTTLRVISSDAICTSAEDGFAWEKAAIEGLLKTIEQELPGLRCQHIDLQARDLALQATWLAQELQAPVADATVCYRRSGRLVPRLEKAVLEGRERKPEPPLRRGGLYLVTGGLGGIGRALCKYLLERYDAQLLIVGRTVLPGDDAEGGLHGMGEPQGGDGVKDGGEPATARLEAYRELRRVGRARVSYAAVDSCDLERLREVVAQAESERGCTLDGVFHLAGVARERLLVDETLESMAVTLRPKVLGTLALDAIVRARPGALFVHFSSVNGFFGGAGAAAYAAAASFVDGFADYQRHRSQVPSFCFSWSLWEETGMSRGSRTGEAARARGYQAISVERGIFSLMAGLSHGEPQLFIGIDGANPFIQRLAEARPAELHGLTAYLELEGAAAFPAAARSLSVKDRLGTPTICEFVQMAQLPLTDSGEVDRERLSARNRGAGVDRVAPRTAVEQRIAEIWRELLATSDFGVEDSFFELGGQSLLAMSLVSRVRDALGVELPMSKVFSAPTIAAIAFEAEAAMGASTGRADAASTSMGAAADKVPPIVRVPRDGRHPLSLTQQRLWILDRMEGQGATQNDVMVMSLSGPLHVERLAESFARVVSRHEILRTTFVLDGEMAIQRIAPASEARGRLEILDLRGAGSAREPEEIRRCVAEIASRPFNLSRGPLLRAVLLELGPESFVLALAFHHIITDAWSLGILMRDWAAFYRREELPELPLQYVDFSHWQRAWLSGAVLERQLAYWRKALEGAPALLELPVDHPRQAVPSHRGAILPVDLDARLVEGLRALGAGAGATLFMTLMAAFVTLLARYSGQRDIVVGVPVANRRWSESEAIMGFFVNTLALRCGLSSDPSFSALLGRVCRAALEAYENQDLPFEKLVEELQPDRSFGHNPIVQVMFELGDQPLATLALDGVSARAIPYEDAPARVDLELHLYRDSDRVTGYFLYTRDLFERATIARLAASFERLLRDVITAPDRPISQLDVIGGRDRERMAAWHDLEVAFPRDACIHELFAAQAAQSPDAPALLLGEQKLSYREIDVRANQLAHHLRSLGVGPEVPVAQFLDRSVEMVVGLLGILKAGGVYLPLDPQQPLERLSSLLEDSQAPIVLTRTALEGALPSHWGQVVCLDSEWDTIALAPEHAPAPLTVAENAAYIIYTSGSTGQPKGAILPHRGFINMIRAQIREFAISAADRISQFSSCSFDASLYEIFMALLSGACLLPVPEAVQADPGALRRYFTDHGITVATLPPSYLHLFKRAELPSLRVLISAGEAASVDDARWYARSLAFFNAYGPTEASVCSSFYRVDPNEDYPLGVPIGGPLSNTEVLILDEDGALAPIGAPGEICLGGEGLARGYLGQPGLTAASFVPHPFRAGARLYRTGDAGRWRDDGTILYIGRRDYEVKVRGHRIAPGEVERAMLSHPRITQACVTAHRESDGLMGLAGYYSSGVGLELWPSVAEFFVYDDVLYTAMATHAVRNEHYAREFEQALDGRTVVEIGPGPEAVLSRLCIDAGASKVYAIEYVREAYEKASAKVRALGLEDRIILIHGDAMRVSLPEKVDYCVSEIVGSIGGSEGSARIINDARRFLHDPSCMIPARSVTRLAAVSLQEGLELTFPEMAAHYVERIFAERGYPFDLRLCLKNLSRRHVISSDDVFEDLDYRSEVPLEGSHPVELRFLRSGLFHGFIVWLTLQAGEAGSLDTLDSQESWLPVYLPISLEGILVAEGDVIEAEIIRTLSANGLNPDYRIHGRLRRRDGGTTVEIDYTSYHDKNVYRATPFYRELFAGEAIPRANPLSASELRDSLAKTLPRFMIPSWLIRLPRLPVLPSGKIDRGALPAPEEAASGMAVTYEAPRDEIEDFVAKVWGEVLQVERVGIRQNFFDTGGHSLRMVQVQQRLEARFGAGVITLVEMFQYPTIEGLAAQIARQADGAAGPAATAGATAGDRGPARAETRATRRAAVQTQRESRREHRTKSKRAQEGPLND